MTKTEETYTLIQVQSMVTVYGNVVRLYDQWKRTSDESLSKELAKATLESLTVARQFIPTEVENGLELLTEIGLRCGDCVNGTRNNETYLAKQARDL